MEQLFLAAVAGLCLAAFSCRGMLCGSVGGPLGSSISPMVLMHLFLPFPTLLPVETRDDIIL